MNRSILRVLASMAALTGVACSDSVTDPSQSASLLDAFVPALAGFDNAQSSFSDGSDGGVNGGPLGGPMHGRHRGGGGLGLMGGGLGGGFVGASFGVGFGHRPYDIGGVIGQCVFSASSGRIACDPVTIKGLTITRSVAYTDASGAAQSAYDESTTNTINMQLTVSGTIVGRFRRGRGHHHHGINSLGVSVSGSVSNDTTIVQYASDRTVGGLADASTQRTVAGTSAGQESTVGTDSIGRFTLTRVAGDTVTGVVIPIQTAGRSYPTAGTVVRSMQVTLARDGATSVSSTRREVITYDGSTTATVVITQDGETETCTLPLPRGRMSCG
jgi:hypothetical protein